MNNRLRDTARFYELLDRLEAGVGGARTLAECNGKMRWPQRGVYFFFEGGESRYGSGVGDRVVRIGTHAISSGSQTSLWNRLSQHRGPIRSGAGNHRGSIFRLLVGDALGHRGDCPLPPSWGVESSIGSAARKHGVSFSTVKQQESRLETLVSDYINSMPLLWLAIDDEPGPDSQRAYIERCAIALLSQEDEGLLDPPSPAWLGHHSSRESVRNSSLWNNRHVGEPYSPSFLDLMEERIGETRPL